MKTDTYTKFMLTVIAICLVAIVLSNGNFITPAHAKPDNGYALVPVNADGSVNVKIISNQNVTQDVVIVGWKGEHTQDDDQIRDLMMDKLPVSR